MRRLTFLGSLVVAIVALAPARAAAALIGQFQLTSPVPITYVQDVDFSVAALSGFGDVTARLSGVDVFFGSTTSGCEAADFAGFAAGTLAVMRQGTCSFEAKVQNAIAAGAVGAIILNESGLPLFQGSLSVQAFFPVISTSGAVGDEVLAYMASAPTNARLAVLQGPDTQAPEPGTLALLGLGAACAGLRRRGYRRAAKR